LPLSLLTAALARAGIDPPRAEPARGSTTRLAGPDPGPVPPTVVWVGGRPAVGDPKPTAESKAADTRL
jgi:hypothetical protein